MYNFGGSAFAIISGTEWKEGSAARLVSWSLEDGGNLKLFM